MIFGQTDTLPIKQLEDSTTISSRIPGPGRGIEGQVRFSADTLSDVVTYEARDSIRLDNVNRLIYLYGEASIKFQNYSITADYIKVDLDSSLADAQQLPDSLKSDDLFDGIDEEETEEEPEPLPEIDIDFDSDPVLSLLDTFQRDSVREARRVRQQRAAVQDPNIVDGRTVDGRPYFEDGTSKFTADRLKYNFNTKKGKIYQAVTQESAMFIHGSETKFVSDPGDSLRAANDFVYSRDVLLTTCNAPTPHYGIRSRKQKIVPERQVIVGASNVEIANVPIPLFLPFGFFPLSQGPKNGLIFPRDYEYSEQWGFGLREIGYYFPISERVDLQLTGDIYFKGSWGVRAQSTYKKRYKFTGNIDIGYSDRKAEFITSEGVPDFSHDKSFSINWRHTQDSRAHPNRTFSASVRMQTNGYEQLNFNDAQRVLNNQYSSNISYRKKFEGTPFTLSTNATHSQNTRTGDIQFTLPDVNLNMNRIFPFKNNKTRSPEPKWYEKISLQYSGKFLNRVRTNDSLLFEAPFFENAEMGFNHRVNTSASFRVLKYFNITPAINVEENWYFKTIRQVFDDDLDIRVDTIYNPQDSTDFVLMSDTMSFGEVLRDTLRGFDRFSEYSASISLGTTLFGSLGVGRNKGWFRGIRHVMKPNLAFTFSPDYLNNPNYTGMVQTDIRDPNDLEAYSFFEGGLFGRPPTTDRRMALSYSISNLIEAKVYSRRDSTAKKIKLFNNISISGSHNFVADSLKWTPLSMSGNTSFFKNIIRFQARATWDPYAVNENGRRINRSYWRERKRPLRFATANFRVSTGVTVEQIRDLFNPEEEGNIQGRSSGVRGGGSQSAQTIGEQSILDIVSNFRINHDLVFGWMDLDMDGIPEFEVRTNSINTRGSIMLTPKWDITVSNIGYDFRTKRLTYPNIGIIRDLHCWEMGFNWAPTRGYYSFYIRVRQSPLDFLNLPYRRGNQDGLRRF